MAGADEVHYVIRVPNVRASIDELLERRIHPFLPAYLHLRQQASLQGTTTAIEPTWGAVGDLLNLPGGPPGRPHFRPFWYQTREGGQAWLGPNLPGSYSPASLRVGTPPRLVLATNDDGTYSFLEGHANLARAHLLYEEPLPVLALASFLLRDYALASETVPDRAELTAAFLERFGYSQPADAAEINVLFDITWTGPDGPWFETMDAFEATTEGAQEP